MTDTPAPPPNPFNSPEDYEFFVFIVDGEVTLKIPVHSQVEQMVASLSSDPKVIKLSSSNKLLVREGWTYSNGVFTAPSE